MKKLKSFYVLLCCLAIVALFTGCFSYRSRVEINGVVFDSNFLKQEQYDDMLKIFEKSAPTFQTQEEQEKFIERFDSFINSGLLVTSKYAKLFDNLNFENYCKYLDENKKLKKGQKKFTKRFKDLKQKYKEAMRRLDEGMKKLDRSMNELDKKMKALDEEPKNDGWEITCGLN